MCGNLQCALLKFLDSDPLPEVCGNCGELLEDRTMVRAAAVVDDVSDFWQRLWELWKQHEKNIRHQGLY